MSKTRQHTAIPSQIPVLIVGAGPTGLMASILLGRFGVPNLLVEKHPSTSLFPKARRLKTRTMEILRVLGIEPEIRAQEQEDEHLPLMLGGESLRAPERFRVDGDRREEMYRYSPTTWALIPQDEVEPILRAHAERQESSQVRFGVEVTSLDQDTEGVTVDLLDRSSGDRRSVRAKYLIAADGPHSFVRETLGIGMSGDSRRSRELNIVFRADLESVGGPTARFSSRSATTRCRASSGWPAKGGGCCSASSSRARHRNAAPSWFASLPGFQIYRWTL